MESLLGLTWERIGTAGGGGSEEVTFKAGVDPKRWKFHFKDSDGEWNEIHEWGHASLHEDGLVEVQMEHSQLLTRDKDHPKKEIHTKKTFRLQEDGLLKGGNGVLWQRVAGQEEEGKAKKTTEEAE